MRCRAVDTPPARDHRFRDEFAACADDAGGNGNNDRRLECGLHRGQDPRFGVGECRLQGSAGGQPVAAAAELLGNRINVDALS